MSKDIKEIKKFGLMLGVGFCVIGTILWWRGKDIFPYFFAVSVLMFFLRFFFPKLLIPIEKGWMALAHIIGSVMTTLILTLLFIFVMTPIGLFRRMFGRDALMLKTQPGAESYWITKEEGHMEKEHYERQY